MVAAKPEISVKSHAMSTAEDDKQALIAAYKVDGECVGCVPGICEPEACQLLVRTFTSGAAERLEHFTRPHAVPGLGASDPVAAKLHLDSVLIAGCHLSCRPQVGATHGCRGRHRGSSSH